MDRQSIKKLLELHYEIPRPTETMITIINFLQNTPNRSTYNITKNVNVAKQTVYNTVDKLREHKVLSPINNLIGPIDSRYDLENHFKQQMVLPEMIMRKETQATPGEFVAVAINYSDNPDAEEFQIYRAKLLRDEDLLKKVWELQNLLAWAAIMGNDLTNWKGMKQK